MSGIQVNQIDTWVFVTGVIRGGTTFSGQVMSLPKEVDYIHEPFNINCGVPGMKERYRYLRLHEEGKKRDKYHDVMSRLLKYDFVLRTSESDKDPWYRRLVKQIVGSRGPFYLRLAKLNPFHTAAVIKDPTGALLTEYFYAHFGIQPLIIIRHPTSFIASLRRVNWWPHPENVLDQPSLIEDYFANESEFVRKEWPNRIQAAAAYWRAINKVLLSQLEQYPSWQAVTHEELCARPVETFSALYQELGLPWSPSVAQKIRGLTQGESAAAQEGRVQDLKRNSSEIFELRRDSLSKQVRQEIFDVAGDVATEVYSKESFAID